MSYCYTNIKYTEMVRVLDRLLMQRLAELRKMLERIVVAKVVEEFLEADAPLDGSQLTGKDKVISNQWTSQWVQERSTRTVGRARLVAATAPASKASKLKKVTAQVEVLTPSLVKAINERNRSPDRHEIIKNYEALLAEYTKTISVLQDLCSQSIDPVDFVQTAGETMHHMCEESISQGDPLKSAHTSNVMIRLGHRVVEAGLNSGQARGDPELRKALELVLKHFEATATTSPKDDWKKYMEEILRVTGDVESVLNGENIFQMQMEPNQPIFAAAADLHTAVREWSAKDNDIVAVAKRMAVLMARLSEDMKHDKKHEVIVTSKKIVKASNEIAAVARGLSHECSDQRISMNLLQLCNRTPTISGQLKMLTTVKASPLGANEDQGQEDKEAINMMVGNAQNLMQNIREVIDEAAAASVKIKSQRGPRIRWVRKHQYNY